MASRPGPTAPLALCVPAVHNLRATDDLSTSPDESLVVEPEKVLELPGLREAACALV